MIKGGAKKIALAIFMWYYVGYEGEFRWKTRTIS